MEDATASGVAEIELIGVKHRFETRDGTIQALNETSLTIGKNEFVVLLGPSGCGKTTLLRIIAGLEKASEGVVRIAGTNLWTGGSRNIDAAQALAVVFQESNLFPWLSVSDNIALPLKLRGFSRRERTARAQDLCELVGIAGFENRWPRELSGGMRQRAAIARALSYNPDILLMDEPFGSLDAMSRDLMNVEIQRIWAVSGCTIVFVTHSISEAVFLADRLYLLTPRPGKINTIHAVDIERPRDLAIQTRPEFQEIIRHIRVRLQGTE